MSLGERMLSPMLSTMPVPSPSLLSCVPSADERCEPVALDGYCVVPDLPSPERHERAGEGEGDVEGFSSLSSISSETIIIALIIAIIVVVAIIFVLWILAGRKRTRAQEQFDADEEVRKDREEQAELDQQVSSEIVIVQQARPYVVGYRGDTSHRGPETTPERGAEPVFQVATARSSVQGPPRHIFAGPPT
jgi:hypothetical protein